MNKKRRPGRLVAMVFLWLVATPLLLLLLVIGALHLPGANAYIASRASAWLSNKTGAQVSLQSVAIGLGGGISLHELSVRDKNGDSLLYCGSLKVVVDLAALLDDKIQAEEVAIENLYGNIQRTAGDTSFNYDFIVHAFAGEKTQEPVQTDTSTTLQIALDKATLKNIRLVYHDEGTGISMNIHLGTLEVHPEQLDFSANRIAVDKLDLADTRMQLFIFKSYLPQEEKDTLPTPAWEIVSKDLKVANTSFSLSDSTSNLALDAALSRLQITDALVNTGREIVNVNELALAGSKTSLRLNTWPLNPHQNADTAGVDTSSSGAGWVIHTKKVDIEETAFQMDDESAPRVSNAVDYSHLAVSQLRLKASEANVAPDSITAKVSSLSLKEHDKFTLEDLSGFFWYSSRGAGSTQMKLRTAKTHLAGDLAAGWPSIETMSADPGQLRVKASLKRSNVSIRDVLYFVPQLRQMKGLQIDKLQSVEVSGEIAGKLADLAVNDFQVRTAGLSVAADGTLVSVLKPDSLFFDFTQLDVRGDGQKLRSVLSGTAFGGIPDNFALTAKANGYLRNFDARVNFTSSSGNLNANVVMHPERGPTAGAYSGTVSLQKLDLGALTGNRKTLGPVDADLTIAGEEFDTSSLDARMSLNVQRAVLMGYGYTNFRMSGHILRSSFSGEASMNDPNLAFDFNGFVNADQTRPNGTFTLNLHGLALKPTGFAKMDRRVSGSVVADIEYDQSTMEPKGTAAIRKLEMIEPDGRYWIDSLLLDAKRAGSNMSITVVSDVFDAALTGQYTMRALAPSLQRHVNHFFTVTENPRQGPDQKFDFNLRLKNPQLLTSGLVPGLDALEPFKVEAKYNSQERTLRMTAEIPQLIYSGTLTDSVKIEIISDESSLRTRISAAEVAAGKIRIENLFLGSEAANQRATFNLSSKRDDSAQVWSLAGNLLSKYPAFEMRLHQSLMLAGFPWQADTAGVLTISPEGLLARQFNISREGQRLLVNSEGDHPRSPLALQFRQLDLAQFSSILRSDTVYLAGILNGDATIERRAGSGGLPALKSSFSIKGLEVLSAKLGDLKLETDNFGDAARYDVKIELTGGGNDLDVSGNYHLEGKNAMQFSVDLKQLNLATLAPFTGSHVPLLTGTLRGDLKVSGTPTAPRANGELKLSDVHVEPSIISSRLHIPDGAIQFRGEKIVFPGLKMLDTLGNSATLSGHVDISKLSDPSLALRLRTTDFLALNTTRYDNPLYYGKVFLSSEIGIKGSVSRPVLDVKAKLNRGTSLTYVKPQDKLLLDESRGVVEFRDSLPPARKIMRLSDTAKTESVQGIALHAAIDIDPEVDVRMIVDPLAGDSLYVKGGGLLNFNLDPNGNTSLTGKYNVVDGGYFLSISNLIKRSFKIRKGSSVTWSGDMLDAFADINAIYVIKTSPADLMADQLSGLTEVEKNKYRNLLTFNVFLKMRGFISSPEISFDIQLDPKDRGAHAGVVDTRLASLRASENQLNKQVFALLTLRRFVSENPLESGNPGGIGAASRSSASQVLTNQLNTYADRYVDFVDLDLGVNSYEDYSTGKQQGRTQVELGVSKQLFNDRVTVRVGGNVDVEGEQAQKNNTNEVAGDLSVDYKLTEDGRYKLKAFRERQFENPIEGELTRTGAGVLFTRDFNRFKNIFRKPRRTQKTDVTRR